MKEETVLFILTDDNSAGRFYESKRHVTGDDVRLYFKKPSEFYEYDPKKMVFVCEPDMVSNEKNGIQSFLNDCWYPFTCSSLETILKEALEYNPYVVLFQEGSSMKNSRVIESFAHMFDRIITSERFNSDFDRFEDIMTFSGVLDCMDKVYNLKLVKIADYLDNQKGQAEA